MKISLIPRSREYASTVFDVVKIFQPELTWQELMGETDGKTVLMEIEVLPAQVLVRLTEGEWFSEPITDNEPNEVKRTIKLAVYKLLQKVLNHKGSPWGILTGIRPTKIVHRLWDQGLEEQEIKGVLRNKFAVSSEKISSLITITKLQRPYIANLTDSSKVSVYISIPFCPTRCHYCSFPSFSMDQWGNHVEQYILNLIKEIKNVGLALQEQNIAVETIYMGGGTPTALTATQLGNLLEVINSCLRTSETLEFTVEAGRPDTINEDKLKTLKDFEVERISINPQTMWEPTLKKIGRNHSAGDIFTTMELARKIGFKVINMDLIVGLPGENLEIFKHTLDNIEVLKPENLTLHSLALKRTAKLRENTENLTPGCEVEKMFTYFEKWALERNYRPYYLYRQKLILGNLENVGYCLPGLPCLYNIQMIEERQTILGLGVGAGSKIINREDGIFRNSYNPKDLILYNERLEEIIEAKVDKIKGLG